LPEGVTRASIGPVTTRALRELNLSPHIEAKESTIPALVECLAVHFTES
jgi:uroporphyrinogen-III synthase